MMGGSHRLRSESLEESNDQWLYPGDPMLTKPRA